MYGLPAKINPAALARRIVCLLTPLPDEEKHGEYEQAASDESPILRLYFQHNTGSALHPGSGISSNLHRR